MKEQPKEKRGAMPRGLPKAHPWHPADYEPEDAYAVQAVMAGRASVDQQLRAMRFIVERICGTYDLSFRPEDPQHTTFAEGKRFVGLQLVKFARLNLSALRGNATEQGEQPKE
jgi:hypothetical protein